MNLEIHLKEITDISAFISVSGELDIGTIDDLLKKIDNIEKQKIILDCSGLTFIDSTGIGLLVRKIMEMHEEGRTLSLQAIPGMIYEVLDEMGIFEILREFEGDKFHAN